MLVSHSLVGDVRFISIYKGLAFFWGGGGDIVNLINLEVNMFLLLLLNIGVIDIFYSHIFERGK